MITEVPEKDKKRFNELATHPLQSWAWGNFRQKTGIEVTRLGRYVKGKLHETAQFTLHPIPFTKYFIGYFPKGGIPSGEMLEKLDEIGQKQHCIFIKLEPNVEKKNFKFQISNFKLKMVSSPHPLFTNYTFQLDLTKKEEDLLAAMHSKTRYNIHLAEKKGVKVLEDHSQSAFNSYLELTFDTAKRQKFYAHDRRYHQLMWETLSKEKIAYMLRAVYQDNAQTHTLVSWIVFLFNNVLYYPYGASSSKYRNLMASNLMMFAAIRFGKKHKAKLFDMWGALGLNPDISDPWYGFHRFKQGFGGNLVEFAGSFDLIINPFLYRIYNIMHRVRQVYLAIKSNLP